MVTGSSRGIIALAVLASVAHVGAARADDKQTCSAAYEQAQSLRKEGKLSAAREQSLTCSREVCPEFIRVDCASWMTEIEKSQPSLVLQVRDGAGQDVTEAIVRLDEQLWTNTIDGKARVVDPGRHTIRVEVAGQLAVEATVVANEGEKNKPVVVTIGAASSGAPPPGGPRIYTDSDRTMCDGEGEPCGVVSAGTTDCVDDLPTSEDLYAKWSGPACSATGTASGLVFDAGLVTICCL